VMHKMDNGQLLMKTNSNAEVNEYGSTGANFPKVAIIILNWNGWQDTSECLESLQRITYPNYQAIVVDNGSSDGSIEKIKAWARGEIPVESKFFEYKPDNKPVQWIEYARQTAEAGGIPEEEAKLVQFPSNRRVIFIKNGENLGFAGGNNVGIKYALLRKYPYLCLLNNDTVVDPKFLDFLVKRIESDPLSGIVGGKIYTYNEPKCLWYAGGHISLLGRGPGYVMHHSESDKFSSVSFVTGCLMLLRADVLNKVGLLDPYLFFGAEDADLCLRTIKAGFKIDYEPRAIIWHKIARTYDKHSPSHIYYVYRGKVTFTRKHLPLVFWYIWLIAFILYLLIFAGPRQLFRTNSIKVALNTVVGGLSAIRDVIRRRD